MKILVAAILLAAAHASADSADPSSDDLRRTIAETRTALELRGRAQGVADDEKQLAATEETRGALASATAQRLATYASCAGEDDEDPCTTEYLDAKQACSADDAVAAHPACRTLERLRELRAAAVDDRRSIREATDARELREAWWESRRWPAPDQKRFVAGCRDKYRDQGPARAEIYCACMLELLIDDHPRQPRPIDESELPRFRERTAWMRADCGEFADITPDE